MAATKAPVPPVNLKDRIAALQQRNAGSSNLEHNKQSATANAQRTTGSLRDKIASFEKQGAVPVPRGSFGLGAPPVDDGSSRRRGELMGNRVPGLSRPMAPVPGHPSRAVSPEIAGGRRSVSASGPQTLSPQFRPLSPTFTEDDDTFLHDVAPLGADNGSTLPRHPSTSLNAHATRRSVSDVLPQTGGTHLFAEALPESDEGSDTLAPAIVVSNRSESVNLGDATPSVAADASFGVSVTVDDTPTEVIGEQLAISPVVVNPDGDELLQLQTAPKDVRSASVPPVELEQTSEDGNQARLPSTPSTETISVVFKKDTSVQSEVSVGPSLPLHDSEDDGGDASLEGDMVSMTDRTSATSSKVSTPSDIAVFPSIEPAKRFSAMIAEGDEVADQSLALDTSEAIIVTEPARIVSPIVTRAKLIPVPQGLSPVSSPSNSVPAARPVGPIQPSPAQYVEPSLTPKTTTGSFRAVVHRKAAGGSSGEPHYHSTGPITRPPPLKLSVAEPPQSPGFSDLADLLADAARLEQQLSGIGSPRKALEVNVVEAPSTPERKPSPEPESEPEPEPKTPQRRPLSIRLSSPEPIQQVLETAEDSSSSQYNSPQEFPSTPELQIPEPVTPPAQDRRRSRIVSDTPPPVPPKSPRPRYFSTLLSRKPSAANGMLSMPGAYPRNSVCSEMSEESVFVATPPSPRFESVGSDTSSVRSSSKSWKMPKKGLSRATSFADRLWHKKGNRNTVIIASPEDDNHLSPGTVPRHAPPQPPAVPKLDLSPMPRPQGPSAGADRPTSWVSISSTGSGGLDSALFDAFPSVPSDVPAFAAHTQYSDHPSSLSPAGYSGPSAPAANSRWSSPPAQSSHQKGHSSFL